MCASPAVRASRSHCPGVQGGGKLRAQLSAARHCSPVFHPAQWCYTTEGALRGERAAHRPRSKPAYGPACCPACLPQEEEAAKRMGGRGLEEIAAEPVRRPEDSGETSQTRTGFAGMPRWAEVDAGMHSRWRLLGAWRALFFRGAQQEMPQLNPNVCEARAVLPAPPRSEAAS